MMMKSAPHAQGADVASASRPRVGQRAPGGALVVSAAIALALLSACGSGPEPRAPGPSAAPAVKDLARREIVLETALGQIGRPYRYGGGDGDGFDCSGLVQYVFEQAGVSLPRTAAEQRQQGHSVSLHDAAAGDLVFFKIGGAWHATIYVGDGRVVHAPSSGQTVTVTSINSDYWQQHIVGAVRILR